jgi:hypothetical protein
VPELLPTRPVTNYEHLQCLKNTKNCCPKISAEHYISRSILQEFGDFTIAGLPWEDPARQIKYGINSLTSKTFCKRHNSALSPLDDFASRTFRTIRNSSMKLNVRSLSSRKKRFLVSGEALELWGFKTICGRFYSFVAAQGKRPLAQTYTLAVQRFERALRLRQTDSGGGLYVTPHVGERKNFSFGPLSVEESKRVVGVRIGFAAVEFDILIDPTGVNLPYLAQNFFTDPGSLIWSVSKDSTR